MADFDAQQPVRFIATEATTEIANSSGTTINPVEEFAQGSTSSGQSGPLIQGAVTTAAPTYTTAQTSPISLTTAGAVRVDGSAVTQPVSGTVAVSNFPALQAVNLTEVGGAAITEGQKTMANSVPVVIASDQSAIPVTFGTPGTPTYDYSTTAAVASGASATHSVAGPINIDKVEAAASGEMKVTIAWGITGSEVTYMVSFTSASDPTFEYQFPYTIALASGSSIKLTLKNRDTTAMDVYSTVAWH